MFVPETFALAMVMMITSAVCWGSWANTYKLTKAYRFELFYWDYAIGNFLATLLKQLLHSVTTTLGTHHCRQRCLLFRHDRERRGPARGGKRRQ